MSKTQRCEALWGEMPNATPKDVVAAYEKKYGEKCSPVTARKSRPGGRERVASPGPITAAELRSVKEIAVKTGGLPSLAAEVEKVAAIAEQVGSLGRLRAVLTELSGLLS